MSDHKDLNIADQDRLDAASFRRFLDHLAMNADVQNIDLMILAGLLPELSFQMVQVCRR
jgi:hypothetical protein